MTLTPTLRRAPTVAAPRIPRGRAALSGVLAAVVALGTGELLAGLSDTLPSLVNAVGGVVIDQVPPAVKDLAIALFGLYDKLALQIGIVVLAALAGALIGIAAARHFTAGLAGIAAFGVLGVAAALTDPTLRAAPLRPALGALASVAAGVTALRLLLSAAPRPVAQVAARQIGPQADRRQFLRMAAVAAAVGAGAATGGRLLTERAQAAAARTLRRLPAAARPLPAVPAGAALPVEGLSPLFTPNDRFYRIDTALRAPLVDPASWRLRVSGLVERPVELSYDDLLALPLVESDVTLACVSNVVGGDLVGNARWTGVRLAEVLDRAGVRPGATQIVGRSVDGFTAGFPTAVALDGRDALVAVGMNGQTLPIEHGFPARLVVPGLYGYVSATKWLSAIELATWEAFDGYWVPRGWSKEGPIKTQSRIDVPLSGRPVPSGLTAVAGVAWAPTRGIERVEVSVDHGPWLETELAEALADTSWRQWRLPWDASPGTHVLRVRATDGTGMTQTPQSAPPAPDGASGWHSIVVRVT